MKTAVSIPDPIFEDAERLARETRKSRSQLYAEALSEYLSRHGRDAVTEAMNRVCEARDSGLDAFQSEAARRLLAESEW